MNKTRIIAVLLVFAAFAFAAGCGRTKTVGTPAAADTPATPLAKVLATPEKYDGQTVVLQGVLAAQCASLCDFTYAEGDQSVMIFTGDPKPPKIKAGQPVRVTVQVYQGEEQVVLNAQGLEILPRKAAP